MNPMESDSLRNHTQLKRLEKHIKAAIRRVWPRRRAVNYAMIVFDPKTGEIGITVDGGLEDLDHALGAAQDLVRQHRQPERLIVAH